MQTDSKTIKIKNNVIRKFKNEEFRQILMKGCCFVCRGHYRVLSAVRFICSWFFLLILSNLINVSSHCTWSNSERYERVGFRCVNSKPGSIHFNLGTTLKWILGHVEIKQGLSWDKASFSISISISISFSISINIGIINNIRNFNFPYDSWKLYTRFSRILPNH